MGQERLNKLEILSIEHEVARDLNYTDVIDSFAAAKARNLSCAMMGYYLHRMFFVVAIVTVIYSTVVLLSAVHSQYLG